MSHDPHDQESPERARNCARPQHWAEDGQQNLGPEPGPSLPTQALLLAQASGSRKCENEGWGETQCHSSRIRTETSGQETMSQDGLAPDERKTGVARGYWGPVSVLGAAGKGEGHSMCGGPG